MTLAAGTRLGPYEVLAPLGAGGMGEVYRARDTRLGREVAVKVLPEELFASEERRQRFEREAKALAALNHPCVATLYSFEESAGRHLLVMELVEGEGLDARIAAGPVSLGDLVSYAGRIAEALEAAHAKGIVHRDLKPGNVMVTTDGRVKVLDFGLAKLGHAGESGCRESELATDLRTRDGIVVGTVPFMSPEQLQGRPLDARTDVYSLGVVLYELASGQLPFRGESSAELVSSILRDAPPPLGNLRPDAPADLERIVRRCLEKRPADRFGSAREVREGLAGLVASASPSPRPEASIGIAIAVLPFEDMSAGQDQAWFCEGMADEIMNALVAVDGLRVASRTSSFRARRQETDIPSIGRLLSVGHVLEGSVRTSGSRLRVTAQLTDVATGFQLWSEKFDRHTEDVFSVQDEIAAGVVEAVKTRLAPRDRPVRARPQAPDLEAYRSYLRGRWLRLTKNDHGGALRAFQQSIRLDPSYAPSWIGVAEANVLGSYYGLVPAREACARAHEALATAGRLQGESAEFRYVEGFLAMLERNWRGWDTAYRRALELQPDHVAALGSYGMNLAARRRFDEAWPTLARARQADPLAAFPYAATGLGLLFAGRTHDAARAFEDAFAFEKENGLALWGAGMARVATGRLDDGIGMLEQSVAVTHRGAHFVGLLGWGYAAAGRKEDALVLLEELRARPAGLPAIVSEAWLLGALGKADAAFEVISKADEESQGFLAWTGLPAFDSLRGDPRFAALERKLGVSS